jgi:hypothetical protein
MVDASHEGRARMSNTVVKDVAPKDSSMTIALAASRAAFGGQPVARFAAMQKTAEHNVSGRVTRRDFEAGSPRYYAG